jgi:hypothetical protein
MWVTKTCFEALSLSNMYIFTIPFHPLFSCIFLFVSTIIFLIIVLPIYWTHYCIGYLFVDWIYIHQAYSVASTGSMKFYSKIWICRVYIFTSCHILCFYYLIM